jgi:hypothetical protein
MRHVISVRPSQLLVPHEPASPARAFQDAFRLDHVEDGALLGTQLIDLAVDGEEPLEQDRRAGTALAVQQLTDPLEGDAEAAEHGDLLQAVAVILGVEAATGGGPRRRGKEAQRVVVPEC